MVPERLSSRRYRYRFCGRVLPAWLPAAQAVDRAMWLYHLGQHPDEVKPYLERRRTEAIDTVAAEAYEMVEDQAEASRRVPTHREVKHESARRASV